MHSKAAHRTFITLGIIALAFAGFLPLGYSIIHLKGENNFGKFITKPAFGITHSVYYLNFLLLTIPLVCGYHGKRLIAQVIVIFFSVFALILTFIGCTFIGFHWGGPIHGNTGLGMISMLAGDLLIMSGCLFQIRYNRNQNQDQPTK